jgi:flavodoxin
MRIAIIVHSHTGNTLKVAEKIRDTLAAKGKDAVILRVTAENEGKDRKNIVLIEKPETDAFDLILFGAPVWAFSISPIMREYIKQLKSLDEKKVGCFITQGLQRAWMGGSRSLRQLIGLCKSKGAKVEATELISWKCDNLEQRIAAAAEKLTDIGD